MGWMAIYDEEGNEIGVVGDEPWDVLSEALTEIKDIYLHKWKRKPSAIELVQIFEFTSQICEYKTPNLMQINICDLISTIESFDGSVNDIALWMLSFLRDPINSMKVAVK